MAKQFNDFKALQKPPPISGKWGNDLDSNKLDELDPKHIEKNYATKTGELMVEATPNEEVKWFGVYRTPKQAVLHSTPIDSHLLADSGSSQKQSMKSCAKKGAQHIADKRVEQCRRIIKLTSDLKKEEEQLHSNLHPDIAGS